MKKLIVTILSAVCLGACSSDTEVQDINGVYKYDTSDYSISTGDTKPEYEYPSPLFM